MLMGRAKHWEEKETVGQRDVNRTNKAIRMIKYKKIDQNWQLQAGVCSCDHSCSCGCLKPSLSVVRAVVPSLKSPFALAVAVVAASNHHLQLYLQLCQALNLWLCLQLQLWMTYVLQLQLYLQLCLAMTYHFQLHLQLLAWCDMQLWDERTSHLQLRSITATA